MEIIINEKLVGTLNRLAEASGTTPALYASGILGSYLIGQYREEIIEKVKTEPIETLPRFEGVINVVKDEIQAERNAVIEEGERRNPLIEDVIEPQVADDEVI